MSLTKTQVIALLLGTISAAEIDDRRAAATKVFNGYSSASTQHDSSNAKVKDGKTVAVSGKVCTNNTDCTKAKTTIDKETCGAVQVEGKEAAPINMCVNKDQFCGSVGKIGGKKFVVKCWADPAAGATAVAPTTAKIADVYAQLEKFLDAPVTANKKWAGYTNFWVSPQQTYTDGWYFQRADNKWEEKDWSGNYCINSSQCNQEGGQPTPLPWTKCCAYYPDKANKKCLDKTVAKTAVTLNDKTFTPTCLPDSTEKSKDPVPENAGDDIAAGKIAAAAEGLKSWEKTLEDDRKKKDGYDKADAATKKKLDETYKAAKDKRAKEVTELKKLAGYDDAAKCKADCKASFDEDIVKWRKDTYAKCKDNAEQASCKLAFDIRKKEDTARAKGADAKNFYSMTRTERDKYTKNRSEEIKKEETDLAAAWLGKNKPAAGKEGGDCTSVKCADATMCCGTATPKTGQFVKAKLTKVCGNKSTKAYADGLGEKYTHACFAQRVAATAAATLAVAYSLM